MQQCSREREREREILHSGAVNLVNPIISKQVLSQTTNAWKLYDKTLAFIDHVSNLLNGKFYQKLIFFIPLFRFSYWVQYVLHTPAPP